MLRANSRMGVGGPYEPVVEATNAKPVKAGQADPQFRALFNSWKRLDQLQDAVISIPTSRPVHAVSVNSGFGIRSDPFRGGRAMHAGVDIPGPYGTPVFATADGVAGRREPRVERTFRHGPRDQWMRPKTRCT